MLRYTKIISIVALLFFITALNPSTARAQNGHGIYDTIHVGACVEANGDTLPCSWLNPVYVYGKLYGRWKRQYAEWTRLRNAGYVRYPYGKEACKVMNQINAEMAG